MSKNNRNESLAQASSALGCGWPRQGARESCAVHEELISHRCRAHCLYCISLSFNSDSSFAGQFKMFARTSALSLALSLFAAQGAALDLDVNSPGKAAPAAWPLYLANKHISQTPSSRPPRLSPEALLPHTSSNSTPTMYRECCPIPTIGGRLAPFSTP